jgi:hypothetical protein
MWGLQQERHTLPCVPSGMLQDSEALLSETSSIATEVADAWWHAVMHLQLEQG